MGEALTIIETQQAMIDQLRKENQQLRARVQELEARLKLDSSNSSKPPSSDAPWKAPSERPQGRKRGGQPGHRGHKRKMIAPDEVIDYHPSACAYCGELLTGEDSTPFRHQVTEIPEVTAVVTEHRVHTLECSRCGHCTSGILPTDVPSSSFGPRLQAIIAVCSGAYRMSKRSIAELVSDFFGVEIALGSICNVEQCVSKALVQPVEEARAHVRAARVVHLDETGWFVRAQRAWLWVAVTARVTVFLLRRSRAREVSYELIPRTFRGVSVADGYGVYNWIHPKRRQFCWAHLIRHFRGLFEHGAVAKEFAERMLVVIDRMFVRWHEVRDGTVAEVGLALAQAQQDVHALLDEGCRSAVPRVRRMCKALLRHEVSLWTFARRHDVEPTNNAAERALRGAVLWRKSSFGTDSENGCRFVERILTVVGSLRLQGRHVLGYITQVCRGALTGQPPPPIWVHP